MNINKNFEVNKEKNNIKKTKYSLIELKIMISSAFFFSYKTDENTYNYKLITDIIYNEKTKLVAKFKDFLIYDDISEFFRRYYLFNESSNRIKKLSKFYENYSKIYPNYIIIPESKYLYKNIRKKQKIIDKINHIDEENKENKNKLEKENQNENNILFNTEIKNSILKYEPSYELIKNKLNFDNIILNNLKKDSNNCLKYDESPMNSSKKYDRKNFHEIYFNTNEEKIENTYSETILNFSLNKEILMNNSQFTKLNENWNSFDEILSQLENKEENKKSNNLNINNIFNNFLKFQENINNDNKDIYTKLDEHSQINKNKYIPKLRNYFVNFYEKNKKYKKYKDEIIKNITTEKKNKYSKIFIYNSVNLKKKFVEYKIFQSFIETENERIMKNDFILKKCLLEKYYLNYFKNDSIKTKNLHILFSYIKKINYMLSDTEIIENNSYSNFLYDLNKNEDNKNSSNNKNFKIPYYGLKNNIANIENNFSSKEICINQKDNLIIINNSPNIIIPSSSCVNINNNFYNLGFNSNKFIKSKNKIKDNLHINIENFDNSTNNPISSTRSNQLIELFKNDKNLLNKINNNQGCFKSLQKKQEIKINPNEILENNNNCFSTPRNKDRNENNICHKVLRILQDYSKPKNKNFINYNYIKNKNNNKKNLEINNINNTNSTTQTNVNNTNIYENKLKTINSGGNNEKKKSNLNILINHDIKQLNKDSTSKNNQRNIFSFSPKILNTKNNKNNFKHILESYEDIQNEFNSLNSIPSNLYMNTDKSHREFPDKINYDKKNKNVENYNDLSTSRVYFFIYF